jgi:4-amino-4-deoxy-L-arabinose transferase-like glycosyltransferase
MNSQSLRRLYPAMLAVLGLLLFFPGLGAFGLWDPYEIRLADAARALTQSASWGWGAQLGKPPMQIWWIAYGFKLLGVGELGGRLPIAVGSLAALLATYYAGAPLVGKRGALLGGFALATTPAFLLGARQLTTNAPLVLGAALAVGGLARAAWPERDTSVGKRLLDLILGVCGLAIGQLSAGLLVGVLAPLLTVTIALAAAGGSLAMVTSLGVVTLAVAAQTMWAWLHTTGYSQILGGLPHALLHTTTTTSALTKIGFALFPWIAIAPLGAIRALDDGAPRKRFGWLVLLTWTIVTYVSATLQAGGVQELQPPVGPALMLLVGGFVDELLDDPRPLPFAGLAVALGALVLGRDFFLFPEHYVAVHMLEAVRWPGPLTNVPYIIMAFAGFFGGVIGLAMGVPFTGKWDRGRQLLLSVGFGAALVMALVSAHYIVPQVSKHLSARDLYGKTRTLDPNAPVGQYHFNATGASYYAGGKTPQTLGTTQELFEFLGKIERVFVMAGSDELPNIDQAARQQKATYYVIDDSNSRYLVLSNRLGPNEKDLNPLKRFISEAAPVPQFKVEADFEGKVKLIGYDLPNELSRGQEFKIRLYFQVEQPVGGNYKVFIHFDGPGSRFNGDHVPLEGRFPTPNWVPGYYITDEHLMTPDRAMQPSGYYRVFMGLFAGETRLKVTSGPQDGENRVKLGGVSIK